MNLFERVAMEHMGFKNPFDAVAAERKRTVKIGDYEIIIHECPEIPAGCALLTSARTWAEATKENTVVLKLSDE